eukprot:1168112-Prorocentrum_minimum.AAC.1
METPKTYLMCSYRQRVALAARITKRSMRRIGRRRIAKVLRFPADVHTACLCQAAGPTVPAAVRG